MPRLLRPASLVGACVLALCWSAGLRAQIPPAQTPPAAASDAPQAPKDALGRDTPRGTVLGFLNSARRGDDDIARQYLDSGRTPTASAITLSRQLFTVLDARLRARLNQLSDQPEGSRSNPLKPDQEVVDLIDSSTGNLEIVVERVTRGNNPPVWLFSQATLQAIPALSEEITLGWRDRPLIRFMTGTRIGGVRMFEWVAVLLGLPFFYLLTALLNKILTPLIPARAPVCQETELFDGAVLPTPVRLLILAIGIRWSMSSLPIPLLARQFWSNLAGVFTVVGVVWLLMLVNGEIERGIHRRYPQANMTAFTTLVRVLRRMVDILLIFAGVLTVVRHFGIDPTPALAGLGVGGIAVALAAQKTLENVIAGASLIVDQAVRLGDFLKMGDVQGTVDHIGLRSTRIRTLDRTIVTVPNSQLASTSLETLSARDKFWFHPVVSVRHETTPKQLREVVDGIRRLLDQHPSIDQESVRCGSSAWGVFAQHRRVRRRARGRLERLLEIQEQLLFNVTEIVEAAGTQIAYRGQTIYLANQRDPEELAEAAPTP
jgi:MscS family membrane protein